MSGDGGEPRVLVVDDEPEVAEMVALQLEREFAVRRVHGGQAALAAIDETTDVVLLDRRMPDRSGDEVLAAIRDRELDCRVVMLSAVSPDYDVLELPFDDYLCKPVAGEPLIEAVERQVRTLGDEDLARYLRLEAKRKLLEDEKPAFELESHDGYQALVDRAAALREELDGTGALDAGVPTVEDADGT